MKKICRWMLPFCVFEMILFVIMFLGMQLSRDSEIWVLFALFYLFFYRTGIYIIGFCMGMIVQSRSHTHSRKMQIQLSVIVFIFHLINLPMPMWNFIHHPEINRSILYGAGVAFLSAFLFWIGECIIAYKDKLHS